MARRNDARRLQGRPLPAQIGVDLLRAQRLAAAEGRGLVARPPSDPLPATAQQAVDIANAGGVAFTKAITVRSVAGEKFDRVVDYELAEKPQAMPSENYPSTASDDIPF